MPDGSDENRFGSDEAQALLEAGWTQGSIFRPNEHVSPPEGILSGGIFLVVCTQACSLVLPSLPKEPNVELAIARPLARYSPKDGAATGKEVRRFHLPLAGETPAVEIDITTRFNVPREALLAFKPDGPRASDEDCRNFAGWLGRYYSRIALPNALVVRAKAGLFSAVEGFLKASPSAGAPRNHEGVHSVYIRWSPNVEVGSGQEYQVDLLVLCDEPDVADRLGSRLKDFGLDPDARVVKDGVSFFCEVKSRDETVLTELDGFVRLSEWDYFTALGEVAQMAG